MNAIILDTETTDLPPKCDACEVAYFDVTRESLLKGLIYLTTSPTSVVTYQDSVDTYKNAFHQTFMPNYDFSPQASAINGFTKENLAGQPSIDTFVFPKDVTYLIGHNIMFDWKVLKQPKDVKLICTKELAIKYLTKESGKGTKGVNTLTGLIERYYPDEAKELISNAHSALQDCKLCYLILLKILEVAPELDSFEKLAEQCSQPSIRLPFGVLQDPYSKDYICTFGTKHKDKSYADILKHDKSYLIWVVEKSTLPSELKVWVKAFMKSHA